MDPETIGRFRVVRLLGAGSFASVFLAHDEELDSPVAIKILADNWSRDEDARRRFTTEARAMRAIDSDRIVRVYDIGQLDDGRPYMVTEYADRGSLAERMAARRAAGGRFDVDESLHIAREIAESLIAAHDRRIVHRDLKPSNVLFKAVPPADQEMMAREGLPVRAERMLLADFGIARRLEEAGGSKTMVVGTPHYMAPEQAEPDTASAADERADVYAAAVVLYELLAGSVPYPFESVVSVLRAQRESGPPPIRSVRADVSETIATVLERGLATIPADRYASARAWRDALRSGGAATMPPRAPTVTGMQTVTDTAPSIAQTAGSTTAPPGAETSGRPVPSDPGATYIPPAASVPRDPGATYIPPSQPAGGNAGGPPTAAPPPRSGGGAGGGGGRMRARAIAIALILGLAGGGGAAFFATRAQASEVTLEPTASVGADPFLGPNDLIETPQPTGVVTPPPTGIPSPSSTPDVVETGDTPPPVTTVINGKTQPLYGGTGILSSCDKKRLVDFLKSHADKARAWAGVVGVQVDQISSYVESLKRLVLNIDMRVTNHGFRNGLAQARQSLLQKGTAVLVDLLGIPRVRCKCGNPLAPPKKTAHKPKYTGEKWIGFNASLVVAAPPLPTRATTVRPDVFTPGASPTATIAVTDLPENPTGRYNGFARAISCGGNTKDSNTFTADAKVNGNQLTFTFANPGSSGSDTVTVTIYSDLSFKGTVSSSGATYTLSGRFSGNRIVDGRVTSPLLTEGGTPDCYIAWSGTRA